MVDSVKTSSPASALVQSEFQTIQLPISVAVVEATAFKQQCQTLFAEQPNLSELVLDFSATRFIDSSGIGALVICHRLSAAHGSKLRLVNVPPQVMMVLALTELDKVFDITLAAPEDSGPEDQVLPETHPSVNSRAKRALDIIGGLVGVLLTVLVYIPVAIIIKLDDGGPVFFAQTRCSWLGKRFKIWKFRSMVTDAEARKSEVVNEVEGPLFKNENDPRITKIGAFLRKTSLDEFPQFWNVLKGEMSLVGTRPPTPDEIDQYEVGAWQRLNVKPGMTGEWQVNGRSSITKFEDVIKLDLRYQENWSFFYDIKLIVKTFTVLLSKDSGAH
ncbi:sugar transferase [Leptothoe sp. PORK10 BA2]|uniref:sugar transferase n=1 Tax=Leptothoe sp. PORK10 BA2 TaxID=3110254 RepID=UPI002B2103D1|nr:sugar transferase [Leptothoe sp. PORK10 BA2]MEA5463134.1 sugar transferase [Leptothoe sp. PORK10 BA2]